jgi:hypothetical protein
MNPVARSSHPSGDRRRFRRGNQADGLLGVRLNHRVRHVGEEVQQHLVRPVGEPEPGVGENPVIVPVAVANPVPADVLPGGGVTGISRRQRVKVVKMVEKADLIEPPPPRTRFVPQEVEQVPARYVGYLTR